LKLSDKKKSPARTELFLIYRVMFLRGNLPAIISGPNNRLWNKTWLHKLGLAYKSLSA